MLVLYKLKVYIGNFFHTGIIAMIYSELVITVMSSICMELQRLI
jgi:hypothetical protein